MKSVKISEAVVRRLPIYLRYLTDLLQQDITTISSQDLGQKLDLNPAQIRKDLAYFGEFGRKGIGYDVPYLIEKIRQILQLDEAIPVALIGAGNLGHALCNYRGYLKNSVRIAAIFDNHPEKISTQINQVHVYAMDELTDVVKKMQIRVGILTVPAKWAQQVADQLVAANVEAILNFAPIILKTPLHIKVHNADFTTELMSLAYYLKDRKEE